MQLTTALLPGCWLLFTSVVVSTIVGQACALGLRGKEVPNEVGEHSDIGPYSAPPDHPVLDPCKKGSLSFAGTGLVRGQDFPVSAVGSSQAVALEGSAEPDFNCSRL